MSFIRRVPTFLKEDKGLLSELILMFIFFIWTYFGTIQINKSNACQKIAPHLFWTVFYCRIDFKFNDYNNSRKKSEIYFQNIRENHLFKNYLNKNIGYMRTYIMKE
ncbi:conserved Plasmodium protein, unknown function [Plasmodium chabaudi chabaudi]|uniref:Uncharacterized protein n=1 Tax=Plasmodium chabaudi chabaudi TaxID=31271 RepID=A0A1C6YQZ4_PLACU|nr:conserved Plasmodium protein, unknown function [Plasmodium chabaudi chabaudi]